MSRLLLASCLYLFASATLAGTPAPSADVAGGSVKPGKTTTVTAVQDNDGAGTAAATPARSTTPRGVSPRWHSLLPGMIR